MRHHRSLVKSDWFYRRAPVYGLQATTYSEKNRSAEL